MITHKLQQGTPEWHAFRSAHFSASDAPAMLGESPYKTRDQLLREKKLGITPDVDAATQRRYDDGHRFEALARPLAENIIGEELFPATLSEGKLSASFDGLTMLNDICFEHKTLNDAIAKCEGNLPIYYRIQMEQQLLVSGAKKCLFVASQWDEDNQLVGELYQTWYLPDPDLRRRIIDGWAQFEKDLAAWQPKEPVTPAVASPAESLPAVAVTVTGALTVGGNLAAFGDALRAFVGRIPAKPATDQEFADCEAACKSLKKAEEALEAAETSALAQISDVEAMRRTVADLKNLARTTRLATEKLVKAEKEARRTALVMDAKQQFGRHLEKLQLDIKGVRLIVSSPDFGAAIKGLSSLDSMKNKLTAALLEAQSEANAICGRVRDNLQALDSVRDYAFLFADRQELAYKDEETLELIIKQRIDEHKRAEAARLEAERNRIRAEEERKAREAAERAKAESVASAQRVLAKQADEQATVTQPKPAESARAPSHRLSLEKICELLDMGVPHDLLCLLGFPGKKTSKGVMYDANDFIGICQALIDHIKNVADDWQTKGEAK